MTICSETTRPSCLIVLVYTPTQNTNCKRNWKNFTKNYCKSTLNVAFFACRFCLPFATKSRRQFFEVYTARALNNHITHRMTAVFIMKTTKEVFIIMRAGKIDKRDHEIAKKTQFCQFVNNTSYGFPTCNVILCWKCF